MSRLWVFRITGMVFILSASFIIYYNFSNSGRAPFWPNTSAAIKNIYSIPGNWTNEHNQTIQLSQLEGKISLITFVFLDCELSCPRIMVDLKKLDDRIRDRPDNLEFQIFLFVPPDQSKISITEFRKRYGIEGRTWWNIWSSTPEDLARLSDIFTLAYSLDPLGNRKYKHSNFYGLLSARGRVLAQERGYLEKPDDWIQKIKKESAKYGS